MSADAALAKIYFDQALKEIREFYKSTNPQEFEREMSQIFREVRQVNELTEAA